METYYYGQTAYSRLLECGELGTSVWLWPISERVPLVQFSRMASRYLVVLDGSIIVETETRSFSLNRGDDLLIPVGLKAVVQNAAGWMPSRVLMLVEGEQFQRFIAATGASKPGNIVPPDLAETGKRFGIEVQHIEAAPMPEISKWVMPRPASHQTAI